MSLNESTPSSDSGRRPSTARSSVPRRVQARLVKTILLESEIFIYNVLPQRVHTGDVTSVAYDPSGQSFASGSADTTVKVWRSNGELQSTLSGAKMAITQVKFSPSGDLVLASACDNVARLWATSSAKIKHTLTGHIAKVFFSFCHKISSTV